MERERFQSVTSASMDVTPAPEQFVSPNGWTNQPASANSLAAIILDESINRTSGRTEIDIRADLDAAFAKDIELRMGIPEYSANRKRIAILVKELIAIKPRLQYSYAQADYDRNPDTIRRQIRSRA